MRGNSRGHGRFGHCGEGLQSTWFSGNSHSATGLCMTQRDLPPHLQGGVLTEHVLGVRGPCCLAQPYVSRGPRPGTDRGPAFHEGPLGPFTVILVTTPAPMAWSTAMRTVPMSNRTCVAHEVDSARRTKTPSSKDSGWTWSASSGPTISAHRVV